jgi:hypothetical protein
MFKKTIHLVSKYINLNILILETPVIAKENTRIGQTMYDYKNTIIHCPFTKLSSDYIIMFKRGAVYELIIYDDNTNINYTFSNESPQIELLNEFQKESCKKIISLPENYQYEILPKINDIQNIKYQIISSTNKINYILNTENLIIPIEETGLKTNTPIIKFIDIIYWKDLKTYTEYPMSYIKGVTLRPNTNLVDSILTPYGVHIPTRPIELNSEFSYPVLNYNYYPFIDNGLNTNAGDLFVKKLRKYKENIYNIKLLFAQIFSKNEKLVEIVKEIVISKTPRLFAFKQINEILNKIVSKNKNQFSKIKDLDFIIHLITNDILLDTLQFAVLTNNIVNEYLDITNRDGESVLLNVIDIINWSKDKN